MKGFLIFGFFILLIVGCVSETEPEDYLSQDKMVEVLIDIHSTETLVQEMPFSNDSLNALYKLLEKDVFLKHEVSDSVFTRSMLYYLHDVAEMERIYFRVFDSLDVRVKEIDQY
ncbi:DUF4296 domain-containing protein [Algoriphagus winogradskyi]|uniref:DUF4296 domain-containing protein n=1 Tax=Algoriphagus winogradskyi TaxID=237017 RepID=A0ABY1PIR3_9BACT|nr:DUF4296 domain-containing protein [Algoriphagus winogradskyi]SMP34326.1 protein of unknown function [Algoriphagus winogradskyi]